jgi:hypothetical protein
MSCGIGQIQHFKLIVSIELTFAASPPPDHKKEKDPSVLTENKDLSSSGSISRLSCISFIQR